MHSSAIKPNSKGFWLFSVGMSIVLLSLWLSFIPDWLTFVHMWRVELFASVFFFITLAFIFFRPGSQDFFGRFPGEEKLFIIYPVLAFIIWSLVSAFWAESWRSALHHALVWSEYLVLYLVLRTLLDSDEKQDRFLFVLAGILAFYALPAVAGYISIQVFDGTNTLGTRFARFGEQAVVIVPLLVIVAVTSKRFRWVGAVTMAAAWLLVLASMSRTTMFLAVVVAAAAIIGVVVSGESKGRKKAIAIVLAIFIASPILLNSPSLVSQGENAPVAQRFSDSAGLSDSNGFRKLMIALSLEMIADKPLTGIGADNFGFQVHKYREIFAAKDPNSPLLAYAENEIPERAHNEYLQIAAELGIVGVTIFSWFLAGIAVMAWRSLTRIRHNPIVAFGAIVGIFGFLAASLVTSYSFRLIQNGFFFFFALSIAAKYLLANRKIEERSEAASTISVRWACVAGMSACMLLAVYSVTRVASVIMQERANFSSDGEEAAILYQQASLLDPENPEAFKSSGMRAFRDRDFEKAVLLLQRSIEMGETTSTSFSYLASAQIFAGDTDGAETSFRMAAAIDPRSVFVQARFSSILKANGKSDEASKVFETASSLNQKAAATWVTLLTKGAAEVSSRSIDPNSGILPVMDLTPQSGMYAVMTERLIKHPEEQKFSMFKAF
jgi:O-antigen ligase